MLFRFYVSRSSVKNNDVLRDAFSLSLFSYITQNNVTYEIFQEIGLGIDTFKQIGFDFIVCEGQILNFVQRLGGL